MSDFDKGSSQTADRDRSEENLWAFMSSLEKKVEAFAQELRQVRGLDEGNSHTMDKDRSLMASMISLEKKFETLAQELRQALAENKSGASSKGTSSSAGSVAEEEISAVLMQKTPVTTHDLVAQFKARLRSAESKTAFAETLNRISKIQKTNGSNYVVLRSKLMSA